MPKGFHKHKLLFDENMPQRLSFPRQNALFDVKHISFPRQNALLDVKHVRDDLNNAGIVDPQVYTLAVKLKRLLVTCNIKDFRNMAQNSKETGIIGVSPNLSLQQIDSKQ
jgi:hypothetical protein